MTIDKLLNMTAGGILRWALWRRVAFLREMVNVAASRRQHLTPSPRHILPIPNLVKYLTLSHLGILGTSAIVSNPRYAAQAMPEGGGWIPRRYCWILLANAGCLG